jgi:hypothetical protein
MTADEYVRQIGDLVAARRDQEALAFAAQVEPTLDPPLTAEQIVQVADTLHCAAMMVSLDAWAVPSLAGGIQAGERRRSTP